MFKCITVYRFHNDAKKTLCFYSGENFRKNRFRQRGRDAFAFRHSVIRKGLWLQRGELKLNFNRPSSNETMDKVIAINDALLRHFANCKNCHLKGVLMDLLESKYEK